MLKSNVGVKITYKNIKITLCVPTFWLIKITTMSPLSTFWKYSWVMKSRFAFQNHNLFTTKSHFCVSKLHIFWELQVHFWLLKSQFENQNRILDWLIPWMTNSLIGLFIDWLIGWLVYWFSSLILKLFAQKNNNDFIRFSQALVFIKKLVGEDFTTKLQFCII
jgi:hypothetical protein